MPEWGLFLGELILLRGCEKRGCKMILNSKTTFFVSSTIQKCSTTIGGSKKWLLKSLSLLFLPFSEAWKKQQNAIWYNVNIVQTNFMRFTRDYIFNKKYLLLSCVVYRLTSVFLVQAMDLTCTGTVVRRSSSKLLFLKF